MKDPSSLSPSNHLKLLCTFNGRFRRHGKLRYTGGETRIISVDPTTLTYSTLRSKVSQIYRPGIKPEGFSLKYQLPAGDGDGFPLVVVNSDDDVLCMLDEFQCGELYGKPLRLWLFVCDDNDVDDDDNLMGSGSCRGFVVRHGGRRVSDHNCLRKMVLKQSLFAKQPDFQGKKYDDDKIVTLGVEFEQKHETISDAQIRDVVDSSGVDRNRGGFGSSSVRNQELGFGKKIPVSVCGNEIVGSQNHRDFKLDGKDSVCSRCYPGLGACSSVLKQSHGPTRVINPDVNDRTYTCSPQVMEDLMIGFRDECSGDYKHIVSYEKVCEKILKKHDSCCVNEGNPIRYGVTFDVSREILEDLQMDNLKLLNAENEAREATKGRATNGNVLHSIDDVTEKTLGEEMHNHSYVTPSISDNVERGRNHKQPGKLQKINDSDLEYVKELGSGRYGSVYYGKWKGSDVAIKKIKPTCFTGDAKEEERLVADFWKEAHMLGELHHPNIVSLYGVVSGGPISSLATVTEYMINGSLKQVLRRKDRTIDRRKRLIIAMDAAFGMEYLHEKNIVHFDLKSDNLLVNMKNSQRPVCKIGDFGLSKVKQNTHISGGFRGTIPWMAPELLSSTTNLVTEKVDVYSFGIVMWELLTGEEPYAHMKSREMLDELIKGTLRPEIPMWCDPSWRLLMERCWSFDPESRPTFTEVAKELRAMSSAK